MKLVGERKKEVKLARWEDSIRSLLWLPFTADA